MKAGIIPYIRDGNTIKMLFMVSSNPHFGGPDPAIAKGDVDKNESIRAAAIREGQEELGLKKSNMKMDTLTAEVWVKLDNASSEYIFTVYSVEVKSKKDFGRFHFETKETQWLTAEQFQKVGKKTHIYIVNRVVERINSK